MKIFSFGMRVAAVATAASVVLLGSAATAATAAAGAAAPIRIMPLGDSITFGVGSPTTGSYRGVLSRWLAQAGVSVDYVGSMRSGFSADPDNEGHKGWTIAQLTERVDDWLAIYQPDVILLHIGTNDMVRGNQDAATDLDTLLDRIAVDRPDAQVFVAKIVGLGDYDDTAAQGYRTYFFNDAIPGIVASKGPNFHVVDDSDVHGIDMWNREHPNDYGYRKIAWNWYRALEPVLNPDGPAWPTAGDPYRAAAGNHCVQRSWQGRAAEGCHVWYQRDHKWQLPVTTKVRYRIKAKGRTVTRVRTVTRWLVDD
ncbi:SGNH/GDSL hydrolase family protein [Actinoplanes sp. KI2]|uniref:SGNH/GDSL hydrolase family protein n=1 Tax=Actinoplanes sp. KI2 TaxID=2983315 RepID=UPI0021D5F632|nr:SGNH/GDSL hydrolase family protein [Actinoplanes sp. KI2]MCU7728659.1 SGNH/GDSL hydrolase family protein [Actinoplanes sp. KI2]